MRRLARNLAVLVALLALSATALAQGDLGALTGLVTDPTGASVPDTLITVTSVTTGISSTARTSSAGYYRVPLSPGTYRLEAQKEGFKVTVEDKVTVPVAQVVTVDLALQVRSSTQQVTVTSEAPLLTPSTAEVGSSMSPEMFQTLPIEVGDGGQQASETAPDSRKAASCARPTALNPERDQPIMLPIARSCSLKSSVEDRRSDEAWSLAPSPAVSV